MSEERSGDEDLIQKAIDYLIIENNQKIVKHNFEVSEVYLDTIFFY